MAPKVENELVVAAPIEPTWQTLLDLERVARCLPGAQIEPGEGGHLPRLDARQARGRQG